MNAGVDASRHLTTRTRAWLGGVAAAAVATALAAVAAGAPVAIPVAAGVGGALVLAAGALVDWTFGLCAFTAWLVVGDLLRKFTGNSLVVLGATELIAAAAIARFAWEWSRGRVARLSTPVTTPLLVFAAWTIARAVPGIVHEPFVAVNGVHAWLAFTPLLYAGYAMRRDGRDHALWVTTVLAVGALAAAGGLLQLAFGLDVLNPADTGGLPLKVLHSSDVAVIPRPNSVFMHAGRLSGVLLAALWIAPAAGAWTHPDRAGRQRLVAGATAMLLTGVIFSGQRASFVCLAAGLLLAVTAIARPLRHAGRRVWLRLSLGAVTVLLLVGVGSLVLNDAALRLYSGLFSSARLEHVLRDLEYTATGIQYALETTLWGHGTGAASTGRAYALQVPWTDPAVMPLEGGTGVLLWEWGLAGPILWSWLAWTVARELWSRARHARDLSTACICASALAATVTGTVLWFCLSASAYQSYSLQALLWLTVGSALAAGDSRRDQTPRSGTAG